MPTITDLAIAPLTPIGVTAPHAERKHHRRSISKLNHFEECPGFESSDGTSEAAEEGTRLHELMDSILDIVKKTGRPGGAPWRFSHDILVKDIQPTEALNDDDFWLISKCCKEVDRYLAKNPCEILNEDKVHIWNPDKTELTNGHQDLLLLFNNGATGVLFDWKFGWKPVPPSNKNKQGCGYALGSFMKLRGLQKLGVVFFQPRLNYVTRHAYERVEAYAMYKVIRAIIDNAIFVDDVFNNPAKYSETEAARAGAMLCVGDGCGYCARAKCPKKVNAVAQAGAFISDLPLPPTFDPAKIDDPHTMALVRHWAALLEPAIEDIKKRANEIARINGGKLELALPDGRVVLYEMMQKKHDRVLGDTAQVMDALKDFISPEELLAAASLQLGKLKDIVGAVIQNNANTTIQSQIDEVQAFADEKVKSGEWTAKRGKDYVKEAKNEIGKKLTKVEAEEQLYSTLEAQGLLTRPDGYVEFLKLKKTEAPKQLEQTK